MTKARTLARQEKDACETHLMEEISLLKRRHFEEVSALNKRFEDSAALGTLTAQVRSTASSLQDLEGHVRASLESSMKTRMDQLEARERVVADFERASREAQSRAEDECRRLQAMLASMEAAMSELQKQVRLSFMRCACCIFTVCLLLLLQAEDDRSRLREESTRVHAMRESLKAETDMLREDVSRERQQLHAERSKLDAERSRAAKDLLLAREDVEVSTCWLPAAVPGWR